MFRMIPELTNEEYEIIKRLVNYTIALNKNSGVDGYYSKIISLQKIPRLSKRAFFIDNAFRFAL